GCATSCFRTGILLFCELCRTPKFYLSVYLSHDGPHFHRVTSKATQMSPTQISTAISSSVLQSYAIQKTGAETPTAACNTIAPESLTQPTFWGSSMPPSSLSPSSTSPIETGNKFILSLGATGLRGTAAGLAIGFLAASVACFLGLVLTVTLVKCGILNRRSGAVRVFATAYDPLSRRSLFR
ncbi:unnamed protein product, partial [Mycena citricolor]